jgi:catechol 2,3-dioxygenase-like lactoylglutathione lyase family enzyme
MSAVRINHVSVNARELAVSVEFYVRLLGAVPVPTLDFGFPVQWLAVGDTQLHLFERDLQPTSHHHFAVWVDDVAPVHRAAAELGAFDDTAFGHRLFELPGGVAQLYVRDPAGNLVEVDAPGAADLPEDVRADLRRFVDVHPQSPDTLRARLPLGQGPSETSRTPTSP